MEVSAMGIGAQFSDLPAGALFLASRNDQSPRACIKVAGPDDGPQQCVALFPDHGYEGPGLANFRAWFGGPMVLHLQHASLVLSVDPDDYALADSIHYGEVILTMPHPHMKIGVNGGQGYVNLNSGQLLQKLPSSPPWAICRKWSLQLGAPDRIEIARSAFESRRKQPKSGQ